jgi:hypothetical protein
MPAARRFQWGGASLMPVRGADAGREAAAAVTLSVAVRWGNSRTRWAGEPARLRRRDPSRSTAGR